MRLTRLLPALCFGLIAVGCRAAHDRPAAPDSAPIAETTVGVAPAAATTCAHDSLAVESERATLAFTAPVTTPTRPCAIGRDYDVQVHSRNRDLISVDALEPMQAHHGSDCAGFPATHAVASARESVFLCNNHLMTAVNASGYGVIYATPRVMVDFARDEAIVRWDVSTLRSSSRDWWDVWLTPWEDNLALPLDRGLPDLTGEPRNAVHLRLTAENAVCPQIFVDGIARLPGRFQPGDLCAWWKGYDDVLEPSAVKRTTFELRISRDHLTVGLPAEDLWWYDADLPVTLPFNLAVVQFGHHSYSPTKDGGEPDTWHWDNLSFAPAIPFSIGAASPDAVVNSGTIVLREPAPPEARLRFAANGGVVEIDDGHGWREVEPKRAGDGFHRASYFVAIAEGATTVRVRMSQGDSWYPGPFLAGDFATWSR